jgi:hypothetical protein
MDDEVIAFGVQVRETGRKSFSLDYTFEGRCREATTEPWAYSRANRKRNELATTDTELKLIAAAAAILLFGAKLAAVAEDESYKTVDGLAVYLGVVPAAIVKGHLSGQAGQTMHDVSQAPAANITWWLRSLVTRARRGYRTLQ